MNRQLTAILAATALSFAACSKKEEAPKQASAAASLPEDVQSVAPAAQPTVPAPAASPNTPTSGTSSAAGTLQANGEFISPVTSELASKIQGRVARVLVQEGERVTAGQPLLVLDTEYTNLELQRAQADQARAAAVETDAQRDLARKTELQTKGSVPQAMYDRSQATYEQARASRAAATAAVATARQRIADSTLRAPFTGVIVERRADVGERLGDNSVAFVIAQTSPLKLRFDLPERYIESVRNGQTVRATVEPFPNEKFEGKVTVIAQVVNPRTRSFFVEALFPNADRRLRPGLFARVELDAQ